MLKGISTSKAGVGLTDSSNADCSCGRDREDVEDIEEVKPITRPRQRQTVWAVGGHVV
jgi:hypothetical protein